MGSLLKKQYEQTLAENIKLLAQVEVMKVMSVDMHLPSTRPCKTCDDISKKLGQPFGCYRYQQSKNK